MYSEKNVRIHDGMYRVLTKLSYELTLFSIDCLKYCTKITVLLSVEKFISTPKKLINVHNTDLKNSRSQWPNSQIHPLSGPMLQGHRKRWTGLETAITLKVIDGFTRLAS